MLKSCLTTALPAILLLVLGGHALAQQPSAENLLREIKLALFDSRWDQALDSARRLQSRFPDSPLAGQALFYEAQALESKGSQAEALRKYDRFADRSRTAGSLLVQQAQLSIINLAVELYRQGDKSWIGRARKALSSRDQALRYYAALRMSAVPDKGEARRAVPVLREILGNEQDADLRNRALLALLRIDPKLAEEQSRRGSSGRGRARPGQRLNLEIVAEGEATISLSFPLSMARWLIDAIPRDALRELEREGIDARNLIEELQRAGGHNIVEVRSKDALFRIWID
ncbi:MAG: hypothetical protein V3T83_21670 [Acidobacteriota bacterium]